MTELYLGNSNLTEEGALAVVRAEIQRKKLKTLDLQNCRITDEGALEIANLVKVSGALTVLDLRWNSLISDEAKKTIRDAWGDRGGSLEL